MDIAQLGISVDSRQVKGATADLDNFSRSGARAESATAGATSAIGAMGVAVAAAAVAAAAAAKETIALADAYNKLEARVGMATQSLSMANERMKDIFSIAQRTNAPLAEMGDLITKLSPSIMKMGGSFDHVTATSEAFALTIKNSGAGAQQAASALLQFGQAMDKGYINGDEFGAMAENNGYFLNLLSEELGITRGELRKMSEESKLTSDIMANTLIKNIDKLTQDFKNIPIAVSDAAVNVANSFQLMAAESELVNTTSQLTSSTLLLLSKTMDNVTEATSRTATESEKLEQENKIRFWAEVAGRSVAVVADTFTVFGAVLVSARDVIVSFVNGAIRQFSTLGTTFSAIMDGIKDMDPSAVLAATKNGMADIANGWKLEAVGLFNTIGKNFESVGQYQRAFDAALNSTAGTSKRVEANLKGATAETDKNGKAARAAAAAQKELEKAFKEAAKSSEDFGNAVKRARESALESAIRQADAVEELVKRAEEEAKTHGMNAEALAQYNLAQAEAAVVTARAAGISEDRIQQLEREVAARRELVGLTSSAARRDEAAEISKAAEEASKSISEAWKSSSASVVQSLGVMMTALSDYADLQKSFAKQQNDIDKKKSGLSSISDIKMRGEAEASITKQQIDLDKRRADANISGTAQMMGMASKMFAEGSRGRKAAHQAEMAFLAIEIGQKTASAIAGAVEAVTNQGRGDPYTAIPRALAMAAMMAGVLSNIGASFKSSGGGGAAASSKPIDTSGTVLGSTEASSSASKSLEWLQQIESDQYTELRGINAGMRDLNRNLSGVASAIYRNVGLTGQLPSAGLLGEKMTGVVGLFDRLVDKGNSLIGFLGSTVQNLLGNIGNTVLSKIGGAIFGGKVTTSLLGSGITSSATSLGDILSGGMLDVKSWQLIETKKKGGLFSKGSTTQDVQISDIAGEVEHLMTQVFAGLGKTMLSVGQQLKIDAESAIRSLTVELPKIDLGGKSGADMQKAIEEAVSAMSDAAVDTVFGHILRQYQKLNEGLLETAIRVTGEMAVVNDVLRITGMGVRDSGLELSQSLIGIAGGIDKLRDAAAEYHKNFFSESERAAMATEQLRKQFSDMGMTLPATREAFRQLVEAQDLTTEAGRKMYAQLIGLSGAFVQSADAAKSAMQSLLQGSLSGLSASISAQSDAIGAAADKAVSAYQEQIRVQQELAKTAGATVSRLQGVIDVLSSGLREIRGYTFEQGRSLIRSALQSGTVPDAEALGIAVDAIRSLDEDQFSTRIEFERARGQAAADMDALQSLTKGQLSTAERQLQSAEAQASKLQMMIDEIVKSRDQQLKALQDIYTSAQDQVNAALGIQNAVLSVEAAVRALAGALGSVGGSAVNGGGTASSGLGSIAQIYKDVLGREADVGGLNFYGGQLMGGKSIEQIRAEIAASPEAMSRRPEMIAGDRMIAAQSTDSAGKINAETAGMSDVMKKTYIVMDRMEQVISQWNSDGMPEPRGY